MISLTAALDGVCTLWPRNGKPREVAVVDFVTGNHQNVLQKGELLRSIHLPASALSKRHAMRQVSLTHLGRSAALIIATVGDQGRGLPAHRDGRHAASGAACASRRHRRPPSCAARSTTKLPENGYFDDVHGSAAYKRHVTYYLAEQIRHELA